MSKLLFRLRNVPDDEAEEVRQLLEEHGIETYETDAGNWGISLRSYRCHIVSFHQQFFQLLDSRAKAYL